MPETAMKNKKSNKTRQLVLSALFLALAIALSLFESILPPLPTPIPMRYGLANVAVMAALIYLPVSSAIFVGLGKSAFVFFTRGLLAGLTSLSGTVLSLFIMLVLLKLSRQKVPLLILSVSGALFHNLGQFLVFVLISKVDFSWTFLIGLLLALALVTGTISSLILKAMQRPLNSWFKNSVRFLLLALLLPLSVILSSCTPAAVLPQKQEAILTGYFDTVSRLIVYTDDKEAFSEQAAYVEERLSGLDNKFSIYDDSKGDMNNLKDLNEAAGQKAVALDSETLDLLQLSKEAADVTGGKTNVMLGSVTRLWHDAREYSIANPDDTRLPAIEALQEASKHTDISLLELDLEEGTAFIRDKNASIDVGSIAKGYALQLISQELKNSGQDNFLLDLGGSIYAAGFNEGTNTLWQIGVKNPNRDDENAVFAVLSIKDKYITTSGSYERSFIHEGKSYHHLIDPDILFPGTLYKSVTVISEDGCWGDILTTALFLSDEGQMKEYFAKFDDLEAILYKADDEIIKTEGIDQYLSLSE